MRKKSLFITIVIAVAVLLIIGVPILINECYKAETIYITEWEAADALSYYGTLLGAFVTVGVLAITIRFTKKQIQRDNYLKIKTEKWDKIDSLLFKALEDIHPTKLSEIITMFQPDNIHESITACKLYGFRAKTATDSVFGYISEEDYVLLKPFLDHFSSVSEATVKASTELIDQYYKLMQVEIREKSASILEEMKKNPNIYDPAIEQECNSKMLEFLGITADTVTQELSRISREIVSIRENEYRLLLEQKKRTFAVIQKKIGREADDILRLWRKKNADTRTDEER